MRLGKLGRVDPVLRVRGGVAACQSDSDTLRRSTSDSNGQLRELRSYASEIRRTGEIQREVEGGNGNRGTL